MESLSKYDVMRKKMNKFSDIESSFVAKYVFSITKNKKIETIKSFLDKILTNTYILFEVRDDLKQYSASNKINMNIFMFSNSLNETCKDLEKILLLYLICKQENEDLIYECFMELISKKISFNDIILKLSNNLSKKDKQVLNLLNSDDYDFNILPKEYQKLITSAHEEYINKNIKKVVNKEEQGKIEILKAIKIYNENVDINISSKLNKQKIKD